MLSDIGRARLYLAGLLQALNRFPVARQLAQQLAHAGQALGGIRIEFNGTAKGFERRISAPEITVISGVAGVPANRLPNQFDSLARLIARQADQPGKMQLIGKLRLDIEQQTIKPIRLVQPPGLVMLHGHVENLIAVRGSLRCRLRRAVFRWFHPFNMSHFVRLMTRHLRNDEPLWLCNVCQIADLIVGCD